MGWVPVHVHVHVVKAWAVQKDYNQFKCLVDQFNKAVLEYLCLGMPVHDNMTFTQFYFSAFIVQSMSFFRTCGFNAS